MPILPPAAAKTISVLSLVCSTVVAGQLLGTIAAQAAGTELARANNLLLEVFINDAPTDLIGGFRQQPDGSLSAKPQELIDVGLKADPRAMLADGYVALDRLPGVKYRLDSVTQRLYVTAGDKVRTAREIDLDPSEDKQDIKAESSYGAVLNYSLYGSTGDLAGNKRKAFQGLSGGFDTRLFSPFGTLNQSFTAAVSENGFEGAKRLSSTWAYSDPHRLLTYRAGDFVSGGLSWTRSVYLGGLQVQRNFSLKSDLVTMPMPALTGSAAVPSTLEIYTRNVKTYSGDIQAGPFEVKNFPAISGAGEAQIVIKDSLGRETRTVLPFYNSSRQLRQGLLDFSAELGFPRRNYGSESNDYSRDIMGFATMRYGLRDWLTLEGHAEGGMDFINGGIGGSFPMASYGALSIAAAGSHHDDRNGMLLNGTLELSYGGYTAYGRIQRSFAGYDDAASVSANNSHTGNNRRGHAYSTGVPRSLVQASISTPTFFSSANLNFAYTQLESEKGDKNQIVSLSYSQSLFKGSSFYASAFKDLSERNRTGIYAGLTIPFDKNLSLSTSVNQSDGNLSGGVDLTKSVNNGDSNYGWRVHDREGKTSNRSVSGYYSGNLARVNAEVEQHDSQARISGGVEGAVAVAGGGIFATNRIQDAFAVVNVGAPDVDVLYQNRRVGRTNKSGRMIIPSLNSYEPNKLAIDPKNLPVDTDVGLTENTVVPAGGSGLSVDFKVRQDNKPALIGLVDSNGVALPAGLRGHVPGTENSFAVGYDGQAYIQDLKPQNEVVIDLGNNKSCTARFSYQPKPGTRVSIKKVPCQ